MNSSLRKIIFVVDSAADDGETLARLFEASGHRAYRVSDLAQLETLLAYSIPDAVVVNLDSLQSNWSVVMAIIRGASTEHAPTMLALSGWELEHYGGALKRAGFDTFLRKPVPFREICDVLGISSNGMIHL